MHSFHTVPLWKKNPFIRLLIPFIAGLLLQWYFPIAGRFLFSLCCILLVLLVLLLFARAGLRFRYYFFTGILLNTLLLASGMLLIYHKYRPNQQNWVGNYYSNSTLIIATIQEPLSEKEKSYKARASVADILHNNKVMPASGHIILYFRKDSLPPAVQYGTRLCFAKPLQPIVSSGNPGSFNYKQYASFQDIYFQVFLNPGDWKVLENVKSQSFKQFLFTSRQKIISIIRSYIKNTKAAGLAEAMLIGYKDDLDKNLVQAYANTGVVHVIAISGLHLGLIYWLLTFLLRPFFNHKKIRWIKPVIIITGLWLFSFLTGGSPSVIRSAVMFSCIVLGDCMSKKTSVYNTLAASAFLLLWYNPFWLWDAGFQLSYIAVLSIIVFNNPLYNLVYIPNKLIDAIWKLTAVTIAAQILTTPVSLYHFHQFPLLFILTNIIAVPLSSIVLLGELILCAVSFLPPVATVIGQLVQWLIAFLNYYIEKINSLSFSVLKNLYITIPQVLFLYILTTALAYCLLQKNKKAFLLALCSLQCFVMGRTISFINASVQHKIIVYNIPKHRAIDFISGRYYFFEGDSALLKDDYLENFYIKNARIMHRSIACGSVPGIYKSRNFFIFRNTRILLIDADYLFPSLPNKLKADIIILSKTPRLYIKELLSGIECRQIVIDSSNPPWKATEWIKECASAGIACHNVVTDGAFVMNLP